MFLFELTKQCFFALVWAAAWCWSWFPAGHNVHLDCQKAHSPVTDGQTELSVLHLVGQDTAAKCFQSELSKHPYMLWVQHWAPALPSGWVSRRRFKSFEHTRNGLCRLGLLTEYKWCLNVNAHFNMNVMERMISLLSAAMLHQRWIQPGVFSGKCAIASLCLFPWNTQVSVDTWAVGAPEERQGTGNNKGMSVHWKGKLIPQKKISLRVSKPSVNTTAGWSWRASQEDEKMRRSSLEGCCQGNQQDWSLQWSGTNSAFACNRRELWWIHWLGREGWFAWQNVHFNCFFFFFLMWFDCELCFLHL